MTKLDEFIQELCPDGVKYLPIPELFITKNGYTPSKANNEFWENGTIPWFRMEDIRENGRILTTATQYVSEKAVKGKLFPADSIIIATSATIGEHALIKVPSLANQRFTYLTLKDEFKDCVDMMFVFYYCFRLDEYCKSHLNQGNFASVDMKQFAAFKFPVPPLPVQREIVRILDNFTELTAELTARKKQYAYYRDKLLTMGTEQVAVCNLGDIADIYTGSKPNEILDTISDYEYINAGTENSGYTEQPNCEGDTVTTPSRGQGGIGYVGYQSKPFYLGPLCYAIRSKTQEFIINKYIYHWLVSHSSDILVLKNEGGTPALNKTDLAKIRIKVPPLSVQNRLVEVLDNFDAICTDLSSGLPAEIEARQKQYEYYRDKLLTFKELGA